MLPASACFVEKAMRLASMLPALFLVGCGGEPLDDPGAPAGVLALTTATVDTLIADLELGTAAGPEEEAFGDIRDIAVGPDGSIYVLDASVGTVRVFGPGGEYLRSIARRGEGPGELRRPMQMTLAPDGALWIYDAAAQAVLVLAPDGTEVARYASLPPDPRGGPLSSIWDAKFDESGRLTQIVQHVDPMSSVGAAGVSEAQGRLFLRSLDPATGAADSVFLGENPFRRYRYRDQTTGAPTLDIVAFDPRRLMVLDEHGSIWSALSTEYVLQRRSDGDTLVVRVDAEAAAFTSEERSYWEEGTRNELVGSLPERGPVLWRLFTDDENRLWVHRAAGFGWTGQFDVFREDGQLLGSVVLPGRLSPRPHVTVVRDGHLYAVTFGELNIRTVIRAPLPTFR